MPGSTIGQVFRLTSFGESHGAGIGGVIDGCPAGIPFDRVLVDGMLQRRRPGTGGHVSQRAEPDQIEWLSGIHEGLTTGSPIAFLVRNKDHRSGDYDDLKGVYRPSHADLAYHLKYGHRDHRGGGRSSARETLARVAGGAVAMMLLRQRGVSVQAAAIAIGPYNVPYPEWLSLAGEGGSNPLYYVRKEEAAAIMDYLAGLSTEGDSTGGRVGCLITGVPAGLGEPVFHKLNADLAGAVMSIPAVRGIEFGSGMAAAALRGSEENDPYEYGEGRIHSRHNRAGGIQGGISTGEDIHFSVAFKPASSIALPQETVDEQGLPVRLEIRGRHDPCVVPRAVVIVEAMAALVLADHLLMAPMSSWAG